MTDDDVQPDDPDVPDEPAPAANEPDGLAQDTTAAPVTAETEQLRRLGELHRDGILTDEEFAAKKAAVLGTPAPVPVVANTPPRRPGKRLIIAGAAVLLLIGGGTGVALKIDHDNDVREQRELRAEQQQAAAAAAKRKADAQAAADEAAAELEAEKDAQRDLDKLSVSLRRDLVQSLRKSVTKDFKGRVDEGALDGPILGTSCDPISGGVEDLEEETGKWECLVATEKTSGGVRGYPVEATINYTKGSYTWQLSS